MIIFPAIDLYGGKAVRLYKGDYSRMTVYSDSPLEVAKDFWKKGAEQVHIVDLMGARDGGTPNLEMVKEIIREIPFVEIGGGIRTMEAIASYIDAGASRVILGTAALENRELLAEALRQYGEKIAVGADIREGCISVKGWTETSSVTVDDFFADMEALGVYLYRYFKGRCHVRDKPGALQPVEPLLFGADHRFGGRIHLGRCMRTAQNGALRSDHR